MNPKTTLLLFLVVALLGGAVFWQTRREDSGEYDLVVPLFEGLDRRRLTAVRVDHLERSENVKLERDASGAWYLTDPVSYPVDSPIMRLVLDAVTQNVAVVVSEEERRLSAEGFDPPRVHVEVTETFADGRERKQLIEIGEIDIDGQSVLVRRQGEIYKTLRNLDTTFDRPAGEFRSKQLFSLDPREVVEIRRSGFRILDTGDGTLDMTLELRRRGMGWRMEKPHRVAADDDVVTVYVVNLSSMRVESFQSVGQKPLETYGLVDPELRVTALHRDGTEQTVSFGRTTVGGNWFAKRDDLPYVWLVDDDTVYRAGLQKSLMFRPELLRFLRTSVEVIDLDAGEQTLRLARDGEGWSISESREEDDWSVPQPADTERIEAILSTIEAARVSRYLLDVAPDDAFSDAPSRWLRLTQLGETSRIRFGGRYRTEEGSEALLALRGEDRLLALVPAELGELFSYTRRGLQSRFVLELDEIRSRELTLEHDGVARSFRRATEGVWKHPDLDAEAVELRPVLDAIFFLRAEEHLDADAGTLEPLTDPLVLRIEAGTTTHQLTIGVAPDGRVCADHLATRSVLATQDLHGQLVAIVAQKAQVGQGD